MNQERAAELVRNVGRYTADGIDLFHHFVEYFHIQTNPEHHTRFLRLCGYNIQTDVWIVGTAPG